MGTDSNLRQATVITARIHIAGTANRGEQTEIAKGKSEGGRAVKKTGLPTAGGAAAATAPADRSVARTQQKGSAGKRRGKTAHPVAAAPAAESDANPPALVS